uniref:non-specific serine/threonine protein kinase n=1 Tax=Panagrellus redivivus TaxID=6233 RepID=A0A7E4W5Q8_PANRE
MEVIPEETNDGGDVIMGPPPLPWKTPERRIAKAKRTLSQTQNRPSGSNENSNPGGTPPKRSNNPVQNQIVTAPNANTQMLPKESQSTELRKVTIYFDRLEFVRVLGEGAFGEVVLMVDREDPTIAVAVKKIDLTKTTAEDRSTLKKEALIQRAIRGHRNILRYLNMQTHKNVFELYLEYADGGELFDQIEPDYGMEPPKAQFYFRQLMSGVEYCHSKGVVHRDLKPENLLVTKRHCLKICDFGMATIFRSDGKERLLNTRCGTLPYAAPEVFTNTQYRGPPVDIWSCGIVLIAMLVGELPWDKPTAEHENFTRFVQDRDISHRPWCRFDTNELSLLKMILILTPIKRATIQRIMNHPWFVSNLFHQSNLRRKIPAGNGVSIKQNRMQLGAPISSSQPAAMRHLTTPSVPTSADSQYLTIESFPKPACQKVSFSQPLNVDSLLLNKSQLSASQVASPFAVSY